MIKKSVDFKWGVEQDDAFQLLKDKLCMCFFLPKFSKTFEIECDVLGIGIGVVFMQEKTSIAYFSEKLKSSA